MLCSRLKRRAGRTQRTKDLLDPLYQPPCREGEGKLGDKKYTSMKTAWPFSVNCRLFLIGVIGGMGVRPSSSWLEGRNTQWRVTQFRTNLVTPINIIWLFLECGGKLEYRTWKKRPTYAQGEHVNAKLWPESKPRTYRPVSFDIIADITMIALGTNSY